MKTQVKTFQEAAKIVANEFIRYMLEEDFEKFSDMKKCYQWDADDLRDEIRSILEDLTSVGMWDDGTHVEIGMTDITYGEFKKMVMNELKMLGK